MKTILGFEDGENAKDKEDCCITSLVDIAPTVGREMMVYILKFSLLG